VRFVAFGTGCTKPVAEKMDDMASRIDRSGTVDDDTD
jgi:hypothetical protein